VELLQLCLERFKLGINESLNFEQESLLQVAAKSGNLAFVKLLLAKGADLKQTDAYGNTALDSAKSGEVKKYLKEQMKLVK
jgi:ankyrin repeat protein